MRGLYFGFVSSYILIAFIFCFLCEFYTRTFKPIIKNSGKQYFEIHVCLKWHAFCLLAFFMISIFLQYDCTCISENSKFVHV